MAFQYHLVLRKNLSKEVNPGEEKLYYAQTKASGICTFVELCNLVSQSSTASSGDVKVVIDRMIEYLLMFLARGEVVQCGDFGTFQLVQTSKGSPTVEGFSQALLYRARLCFRPGPQLKKLLQTAKGERFKVGESTPSEGEDDRPVIE